MQRQRRDQQRHGEPDPGARAGTQNRAPPDRRPHRTADGHICIPPYSDRHWRDFFLVAGRPELAEDRDGLQASLQQEGIQTAVHYAIPAHLQPAYTDLGYSRGAFPRAEQASAQVLSLPIYPELPELALVTVANCVKRAMARRVRALV